MTTATVCSTPHTGQQACLCRVCGVLLSQYQLQHRRWWGATDLLLAAGRYVDRTPIRLPTEVFLWYFFGQSSQFLDSTLKKNPYCISTHDSRAVNTTEFLFIAVLSEQPSGHHYHHHHHHRYSPNYEQQTFWTAGRKTEKKRNDVQCTPCNGYSKGKMHLCTGPEALYRP